MNLIDTLRTESKRLWLADPAGDDAWSATEYEGVVFDINNYGGEFSELGDYRSVAYLVFNDVSDTSAGIDLGSIEDILRGY